MLPSGAVGLVHPGKGVGGIIGRAIAGRLGVPYSHTVVALGNGQVWESTWKWTRLTHEAYWLGRTDWWAPLIPLNEEQARVLRSCAYFTADRIHYSLGALLAFVIRGVPRGRGHELFCSYGVAEMHMVARDFDASRVEKPWTVTPATWLDVLSAPDWRRLS